MKLLTAEQILSAKLKVEKINIPEWGGEVLLQEPTGYQRSQYEEMLTKTDNDKELRKLRGFCAAQCLVKENGDRLFTDEQIDVLNKTSANALDRVLASYQLMSLIKDEDIDKAAKN